MTKPKKIGGRPALLRQHNLQAVTARMRKEEVFSKIDLARELNISSTTMGKLFGQLEAATLIEPSENRDNAFGRPKAMYRLSGSLRLAAVVIGIRQTAIRLADLSCGEFEGTEIRFATGKSKARLFARICKELSELERRHQIKVELLGICLPGLIDSGRGQSVLNPNLPFLEGSCPAIEISASTGSPAILVHEEYALNRAQLPTLPANGFVISLDFSSGVGMCVLDQGKPLRGKSGFAGEIGHIVMNPGGALCGCGNRGCLETMASDRVFAKACGEEIPEAIALLEEAIPTALKAAEQVVSAQAMGIAAAMNLFNPAVIYVHSHLSTAYPDYLNQLKSETRQYAIAPSYRDCKIQLSNHGKMEGTLRCCADAFLEQQIQAIT